MTGNITNVQDIWIDVNTVAKLRGVTKRAVRLAIRQGRYISKTNNIRGGKSYRILLSSLEPEMQNKYLSEYYNSLIITETSEPFTVIDNNKELKQDKIINEKQKQIALARLDIVRIWQDFRKNQKNKSEGNKKFLELYNTGEFYKEIYTVLGNVAIGSLCRWNQLLGGTDDWSLLVSDYKYKNAGEYRTSLTQDEINIFMKLVLSPNRFSIGKSISLTKYILYKRGIEILPKEVTFRRYAENFKKYNYDKWILAREGEKALKDKVEPFIVRDATLVGFLD